MAVWWTIFRHLAPYYPYDTLCLAAIFAGVANKYSGIPPKADKLSNGRTEESVLTSKALCDNIRGSSNGRTAAFEAVYPGSSPGPRTKEPIGREVYPPKRSEGGSPCPRTKEQFIRR